MPPKPLLITLAAVALGLVSEDGSAIDLSEQELARCEELLGEECRRCEELLEWLLPFDEATPDQMACIATLAQLGIFQPHGVGPAIEFPDTGRNNQPSEPSS